MTKAQVVSKMNGKGEQEKKDAGVRSKFIELGKQLCAAFPERKEHVRGLLVAALSGEHMFLIGPPGTAKSMFCRQFAAAIDDARFFQYLLTRYTEPNEIFGPIDLQAWNKSGVYERRVDGFLPTAHVVFLDEIFKANSSILNSLLTAVNERMYFDDGKPKSIPLRTVVAASNEMPQGEELEALYDRFLLRYQVDYVKSPNSFAQIVRGTIDPSSAPKVDVRITLADIEQAQQESQAVQFDDSTIEAMFTLANELKDDGIVVSDRRWAKLAKCVRAYAYFCGDKHVDSLHFEILAAGLWREPDELQRVQKVIARVSAPQLAEAVQVYDAIMEQVNGLPAGGSIRNVGGTVAAEIKSAKDRLKELGRGSKNDGVRKRIKTMLKELTKRHNEIIERVRTEYGMQIDDDQEPF